MKNDNQQERDGISPQGAFSLLLIVVHAHRMCILPFIRRGFGAEALGWPGLVAFLMIIMYAGLTGSRGMINYFWWWLAFVIVQRVCTVVKTRRGAVIHSHFQGVPWLALKFVRSDKWARGLEQLFCMLVGFALLPLSRPVGAFVLLGWLSLGLHTAIQTTLLRVRRRRMNDAMADQRYMGQVMRGEVEL